MVMICSNHNVYDSYIDNHLGDLAIRNLADDKDNDLFLTMAVVVQLSINFVTAVVVKRTALSLWDERAKNHIRRSNAHWPLKSCC